MPAFGQSSSSPFGSPSVFGQASNAGNTNPFAPKPFGNTTPFGSQTGGSIFGGTSTGVFGAQSTPSAFGSSTPAFGASTTPAFGQTPAFGGFGSSNTQSSPFGGQSQPSQPAFGSGLFGSSTPFGAASQPAFGATSSPAFGASSTPAFGAPSTPAFGATSTPAFGSTSNTTFGSTGGAFGMSGSSLFGSSTPAFGAASTPAFGAASTPAFAATNTPAFGATNNPFGAASTPAFGAASTPAFGASTTPSFGSSFGQSTSTFGAQSSPFGAQATTTAFGSSAFGQSGLVGQRGGTRVTPYAPTPDPDGTGSQAGKLESISAMPAYKEKSHEELRWEDYQSGDKGGPAPAGQSTALNQPSNIFSSPTSSNPFAQKPTGFNSIGSASAPTFNSSPFGVSNNANPFGATTASTPSLFNASTSPFGTSTTTSVFGSSSNSGLATAPSFFNSSPSQATTNFSTGLNFGNTQSSPLFQSTTPSLPQGSLGFGQTSSAFGQTNSTFGQTNSAFGQTNSAFGQTNPTFGQTNPTFGQTNSAFGQNTPAFSLPSTGFGLSSTPTLQTQGFGQAAPSLSNPFQSTQTAQPAGTFGFSNICQTQSATSSALGITPSLYGQMQSTTQSSAIAQPMPVMNPFGTLPAMPQMSIGRTGTSSSIQYGISSLPVVDKPAPVRISSLLTSRHLTQRRFRLPARKYNPKSDGPKVPFFGDEEETQSTPKADALFVPRENPRALVVRPLDQWHSKLSAERTSPLNQTSLTNGNGKLSEAGLYPKLNGSSILDTDGERAQAGRQTQKQNGVHEEGAHISEKEDSYTTITGHRAGEAAIVYEHGADIEALMPKLRHSATSGYYTIPRIQELAAKERAVPGSCRHVRDFVVGRKGYGSIKFLGETDVRRLDLENIVEFNNREVVVYPDESKKPPVGQGLNKPAEVTLLNIKFFNKKTGEQLTEGASAERCKANLIKKSAEQGAEFLSYDPLKGEWRFRVNHFSVYKLEEEGVVEGELHPSG